MKTAIIFGLVLLASLATAKKMSPLASHKAASDNRYSVLNSWGSSTGNNGGVWTIGDRVNQRVAEVYVGSSDEGRTLLGTMRYDNEGPIGFRATRISATEWQVENQWGGVNAPWNRAGVWTIGSRPTQPVISWYIKSTDGGRTYQGTNTYKGEGPIGFIGNRL